MSIEDASALLWQIDTIPPGGFAAYKVSVLKELSECYNVTVGRSGKRGNSLKRDYLEALTNFVC